jgi:hypothetical protein
VLALDDGGPLVYSWWRKGGVRRLAMPNAAIAENDTPLRTELENFLRRHRCKPKPVEVDDLLARVQRVLARREPPPAPSPPRFSVRLRELHDAETGRIDASKVAEFIGVPLADLARGMGARYTTVHKTPTSPALQDALAPIKRSLEILDQVVGDRRSVRAWLNSQHPDLGMRTPLQAIVGGHAGALCSVLENAIIGLPT